MRRLLHLLLLPLLWLALQVGAADLVAIPPLTARVTDLTGTLDEAQRGKLEATLQALEQRKGAQVGVLLLPTTQPEPIETFGIRVAEAWELGRKGVTANVVAPGFVETDMTAFLGPDDKKQVCEHIVVGRLGVPEDIAAAVGYLAADDAGYITGQVLVVDGGLPM